MVEGKSVTESFLSPILHPKLRERSHISMEWKNEVMETKGTKKVNISCVLCLGPYVISFSSRVMKDKPLTLRCH